MRVIPLCQSAELGDAIGFAKSRYQALASTASRPSSRTLGFDAGMDSFLCRFLFADYAESDSVQIIKIQSSGSYDGTGAVVAQGSVTTSSLIGQTITITTDEWDSEDVFDTPFIATFDHSNDEIGLTGTLAGTGGGSGNPVVLTSSNTAVCAVSGSTITVVGSGRCFFTLSQAGGGGYAPARPLVGGEHLFHAPAIFYGNGRVVAQGSVDAIGMRYGTMEARGRVVARGSAQAFTRKVAAGSGKAVARGVGSGFKGSQSTGAGSAVVLGSVAAHRGGVMASAGGAVARGAAVVRGGGNFTAAGCAVARGSVGTAAIEIPKPTVQAITRSFTYAAMDSYQKITLLGTAVRGGVMTYQLLGLGGITEKLAYSHVSGSADVFVTRYGNWYGTATFYYTVTETKDGVAATSMYKGVTIRITAPSFTVTASYGRISWSGGVGPYYLSVSGVYQNLPFIAGTYPAGSTFATIPTSGWCTTSGVFTITDSSSPARTGNVNMSACGVPTCAVTPTGLQFTYNVGNVFRFGKGTQPYNWTFELCEGAAGSWVWYTGDTNVVQLTMAFTGCYNPGGGLRVTDATGAAIFKAFTVGSGPSACAPVVVGGYTRIYSRSCEVSADDIYHATNSPGGVFLDSLDFGWGIYIYVGGRFKIKMGVAAFLDNTAGTPDNNWHSFSTVMPALLQKGVADPVAAFDIAAWEGVFGSLATPADRWGKLHVVELWELL